MFVEPLISAADFAPFLDFVKTNAVVLVPAGVGIVVTIQAIKALPGMIKTWIRA